VSPDPSSLALSALLEAGERPASVSVRTYADRFVLQIPPVAVLSRTLVPASAAVGGGLGLILLRQVFRFALPEPWFSLGILGSTLTPFVGAAVGVALHMMWMVVRAASVWKVELSAHKITLFGMDGQVLWKGSVHQIEEVELGRDRVSAVLALEVPDLVALRIHGDAEARWLLEVLRAWRAQYSRSGCDPDYDRVTALGGRVAEGGKTG